MIQSRLFLLRDNNFIHGALSDLKDVFIHLELCYTLHERSFSKIHNRGTLNMTIGSSEKEHLRLCSHLASFLKRQCLFYIIILWSKPCFQKSPERFLKRHRWRLFLQLRASFQVEKKFNFSEKNALRQAHF